VFDEFRSRSRRNHLRPDFEHQPANAFDVRFDAAP
jgi:hypothetical protein